MIDDLDTLMVFSRELARANPRLRNEILREPGLDESDVARLKDHINGIPDEYLSCLRRFDLSNVRIGFFELFPSLKNQTDIVESLIDANSRTSVIRDPWLQHSIIAVGRHEVDPICIRSKFSPKSGEVVRIQLGHESEPIVRSLAVRFSVFLVLAGRLEEQVCFGKQGSTGVGMFLEGLGRFQLNDEQKEQWQYFAEAALVDS
jgi:hypothetical protein